MTRPRVLLVDDDEDVRHMTRVSLGFEGFDVVEAENGEEGLASMRGDPPAAVVLDVMMPGLDGLGVLRLMREEPSLVDVPVVVLTAKAGLAAEREGWDAGATAYLTKPFTGTALAATLRRMLEGSTDGGRARHDMAQRFAAAADGAHAEA
jgi:two-component system OmpR family response regulator